MTIFVVDDSLAMRKMIIRALREGGLQFNVLEASDGLEALALLAKGPAPQLILCDIHMPKMDGFKFAAAVRQRYTSQQVKLAMLTAKADAQNAAQAKNLGVDAFLAKPFDADTLVAEINALFKR